MTTEESTSLDVLYEAKDAIATITFNRPEKQNTITPQMLAVFAKYLLVANQDSDVRAIVITGSGKFFCAGLDLRGSAITASLSDKRNVTTNIDLRDAPPTVLHHVDKPTICALNGSAAGYGMDLALGCDIRVMSEGAKMAAAFTARGAIPESGGTWILPRLLGWAKAAELIFTGRTLDARQCEDLGLVNSVVPADECLTASHALANEISANAPLAVQAAKRMMRMGMNENFDDHVHHVFMQLLPLFQTEDLKEGMAAFMERRPADFKGR